MYLQKVEKEYKIMLKTRLFSQNFFYGLIYWWVYKAFLQQTQRESLQKKAKANIDPEEFNVLQSQKNHRK